MISRFSDGVEGKVKMKTQLNWDEYTADLVTKKSATATNFELLQSYAKGVILDAGCGTGIHLGKLVSLKEVEAAIGVDVGKPGLVYGESNFPSVQFIKASLYQLPFPDNYFDLVYSLDVVEHLDEPQKAIQELKRVCKPKGVIYLQTPNYPIKRFYDLLHWLRGSKPTPADDPTHVYYFNTYRLKHMVEKSGLQVIHLRARNIAFNRYLPQYNKLLQNWIGHIFGQKTIIIATKEV
jgi:ubiquinone/menaquinone biosynthesis C-methylase UbiE